MSEHVDLRGRRAIVTGANTGIGLETTRVLALRGCDVTMACRDLDKANRARDAIIARSAGDIPEARITVEALDLASLDSVRRFTDRVLERDLPLSLLINNAGVMLPDRRETRDGFEAHFGINHLGHFLLTRRLEDALVAGAPARVVMVASDAMHMAGMKPDLADLDWKDRKWSGWRAYGASKLMNLMFSNGLTRRLEDRGVVSNALHPGIVATELGRHQPFAMKLLGLALRPFTKDVERGAATTMYCAVAPELRTRGGGYFSNCRPARAPRLAAEQAVQDQLWAISEQRAAV